jgi:hypothetical protein
MLNEIAGNCNTNSPQAIITLKQGKDYFIYHNKHWCRMQAAFKLVCLY